jgi:translation initiation factor 4A
MSTFIPNEEYEKEAVINEFEKWDDIKDIDNNLLRGIYAYGFENPSVIQKKSILTFISRKDLIAQAQSGTGKTGAFAVGTLSAIDLSKKCTQAMVLSPTRELSKQSHEVITNLGKFMKGLKTQLLIGGTEIDSDISLLKKEVPHIIIGCPGRTHDMLRRRAINNNSIDMIILDEADEMLSSGFKEQVYNIFQYLNKDVQVCLYSATLPQEILTLTLKFMRDPIKILVKTEMLTLEGISQYYIALENDQDKYITLKDIYPTIAISQCIIYCNSVKRVKDLNDAMISDGFPVACIHSGMDKAERADAYASFKRGHNRVLISSNVTARGIDIQQVRTVINFDIPKCVNTYLHRIGRSGRWGRKGIGINFLTRRDVKCMRNIEQHYATEIKELPQDFVLDI